MVNYSVIRTSLSSEGEMRSSLTLDIPIDDRSITLAKEGSS